MRSTFFQTIRLTVVCLVFFVGVYSVIIYGFAQLAPNHGKGNVISENGKTYYSNVGQSFTKDQYFNSRPSAVAYNAAGSGGSNKAPGNTVYLAEVQARIDTFLVHNPGIGKSIIPSDLVTASGSGLDPDISVAAAYIQVKRIAIKRKLSESALTQLIASNIEKPLLGLFGLSKINVLQLNLALDKLK